MNRAEAHMQINVISLEPQWCQHAKLCKMINQIFDEHEMELKKAWIDGSDANYKCLKDAGKIK